MSAALAVAAGVVADRLLGEPPTRWHPVAWFGTVMGRLEARLYADNRPAGVAYCGAGVAMGLAAGWALNRLVGRAAATAAATAVAVAGRMLDEEALAVGRLLDAGELDAARTGLSALVGRSASELDETAASRAVIESVAENTVDAVTAAVWFAALGGAPAVLAYRAINTMDAMVGHRNVRYERFGWASARLDDVANWLPARLTAGLTLLPLTVFPARCDRAFDAGALHAVRRDAVPHPSPNGGLIEAAFAHQLGVTLGGTNRYGSRVEWRGRLGTGPPPGPADIVRAVGLRRSVSARFTAAVFAMNLVRWARRQKG